MYNLEEIAPCTYLLPKTGAMHVPGLIIATPKLLSDSDLEKPLEQVKNVAHLSGIQGYSIAMPDIHWGYGFPIGGVAAMDAEEGVISPGGVGYDINCGVRLAMIPLPFQEMSLKHRQDLLREIFQRIPSGVGHGHRGGGVSDEEYRKLLENGAKWSISQGYGFPQDLEHTESHGCIEGANYKAVSAIAKERGRKQIGSIGSGNHFVEIGEIEKIFLPDVATKWGVRLGDTYALIHSGSRGFGHQVCQDTLNQFMRKGLSKNLPDAQLVAAKIQSPEGQTYFAAMAAAANFAFNNRQQILHAVRESFGAVFRIDTREIRLIYDVCHNIAKFETYEIEGKKRRLCVHRKGATRAFGMGAKELTPIYQSTGQPVLVPGDMGRASYLMRGLGNTLTWCSACHGAGRAHSRVQSLKSWKNRNPIDYMKEQGVSVLASSFRTIAEEMPDAYKNVDDVVEAVKGAKLADPVGENLPLSCREGIVD